MGVLQRNQEGTGHVIAPVGDDDGRTFDLRPEGAQILLNVYQVKIGGFVDDETVEKLVGLRLAAPRAVEPAPVVEPRPAAVEPRRAVSPPPSPEPRSPQAKHQRRTRGREVALQVLYQVEQNPGVAQAEVDRFLVRRLQEPKLCEFARGLVAGVKANGEKIDAMITEVAENWRLDRMAAIDRNILRLGAFEMLFETGVPPKVAINEALELAKRYSTAQSSRFVNGILDRLLSMEAARIEATAAAVEPEPRVEPEAS